MLTLAAMPGRSERLFLELDDGTSGKIWAMLDTPDEIADSPLVILIHGLAEDDPWIPSEPYRLLARETLENTHVLLTKSGGHVGFHSRDYQDRWHDAVAGAFFSSL